MYKILLCIDGSEQSLKAAEKALKIAKKENASITALHVSHISLSIRHTSIPWDQLHENNLKEIQTWLENITKKAMELNIPLKAEAKETDSSIIKEILKNAEENNVDLIILGNTGRSRFERLLLGSVAQGVVMYAKCSVLVVR